MKKTAPSNVNPTGLSRRTLLGAAAAVTGALTARDAHAESPPATSTASAAAGTFAFEEATVAQLRAGLESGKHTARGLTEAYLNRIRALDRTGDLPLCSVIELNPDALAMAEALDTERKAKGSRGPLHGIPVLLKDNIATADRMQTTAGSLALVGAVPPRDAFIVERLRAAGAVLLGKTNLSEWANFRSTHAMSGWSARGGLCRNPYALDRTPSGSSSGSGAATAANFCAVAVGTETDGSIVSPASACSLVGLKPTVGLVSRAGIIPISATQDTAGPMTRSVADAAVLLGVLAGEDPRDAVTATGRGHAHADYTQFLDPKGLAGARIGVPRERFFGYHPATDAVVERALELMKAQGAVLVDPAPLPNVDKLDGPELEVMLYEFKAGLEAYLAQLGEGAPVRTLADLIAFNEKHRDREMPYFGQELLLQAREKGPLTDPAYRKALAACRRFSRAEGVDAVMNKHKLDALVAPTQAPAGPIDLVLGDHWLGSSSTPAAVSGYPSITVPAGDVHGLPVGVSFIGRAWSEPVLFKLAYAYEQASHARRKPGFVRSVDLRGA
ncbi:amidase [Corallococcus sp. CA031C]